MAHSILDHLGLTAGRFAQGEPTEWTAESLAAWHERYLAVAGAQVRLLAGDPSYEQGKNLVLLPTGDVLVEHVQWQVSHLHVSRHPGLFDRLLGAIVGQRPVAPTSRERSIGKLDNGWPARQTVEVVNTAGESLPFVVANAAGHVLAPVLTEVMTAVDEAISELTAFESLGPTAAPEHARRLLFVHLLRCALVESALRWGGKGAPPVCDEVRRGRFEGLERIAREQGRSDNLYGRFHAAVLLAVLGDQRAVKMLDGPWPPTNSGIEIAEGRAALFLLGIEDARDDPFSWHASPGQPGAGLRHLLHLAKHAA